MASKRLCLNAEKTKFIGIHQQLANLKLIDLLSTESLNYGFSALVQDLGILFQRCTTFLGQRPQYT